MFLAWWTACSKAREWPSPEVANTVCLKGDRVQEYQWQEIKLKGR